MGGSVEETSAPQLSVIVPVFNGESFIAGTIRDLVAYLSASARDAEIIVVDDGSTDRSAERARAAAEGAPIPVRIVGGSTNEGKGAAVRRGMREARGRRRVFIDADLAYPPADIERVVETLEAGADVAVASRVHEESRYLVSPSFFRYLYTRHVAGRIFNWIVRIVLLPGIRDTQAGLKGFTAAAAERLFAGWMPTGFGFDLALLYRARRLDMRVRQVPVFYRYDTEPTTFRFLLDTATVLRDLVWVRARIGLRKAEVEGRMPTGPAVLPEDVTPALASPTTRAVLVGVIGLALIALVVFRLAVPNGTAAVAAWVAALGAFAILALRADGGRLSARDRRRWSASETAAFLAIVAAAAALRLVHLADTPPMMHGDTAECGLLGLKILHGQVSDVFDFSLWYTTPFISFLPYAASFAVTGLSVLGLRLPSALLGIGTVVALYVLARTWFGTRAALLSTALFAASHSAIHFSRIGLWNVQVLFYALAAFAFVAAGLRRGRAVCGAAAGVFSGLALYSYTAGRLIPIVVVAFLVTCLRRRETLRFGVAYLVAVALTATPLVLNYVKDPSVLDVDRTASVWVLADINRPHVEGTLGATTPAGILLEQVRRTLEGFVTLGDTSSQYGTTQALLSPFTAVLFAVGVLLALWRLRDPPYRFLLLWLGLGLLLGSVLVIDPPAHTRLIIVFPLPFLFAAVALDAAVAFVRRRLPMRAAEVAIVYVFVIAQSTAFNLVGYHGFIEEMQSVPREWDVLKVMDRLRNDYDYYLFTGPFLFADSPILRLFSTGTRAVSAFSETDVPNQLSRDAAFVLTPEFRRVGAQIARRFPSAERYEVAQNGVVKAFVYTCTLANGCRRGAG